MNVTIFDTHNFEREFLLAANNNRHIFQLLPVQLDEQTAELARGSEVVSIFVNDNASAPVLEKLAALGVRYIALRSAGYNNVDIPRAQELGIKVAHVPAYSPYSVAEHTIALMLGLNRKLVRAHSRVRDLNFSLDGLVGFDMNGKTVGIIGTGKIGAIVAKILSGFGCSLVCYDLYPDERLITNYGVQYMSIDELCSIADIITLHAPLTPETKYLINAERIQTMKRGVMLINTSRGALVETKAVIDGLKSGIIGYLGLDVYELEQGLFFHDLSEVVLQDDMLTRLMTFPNVLITSHQAFLTQTALHNIAETTMVTLNTWDDGQQSPFELVGKSN